MAEKEKSKINWFPGHMKKTLESLEQNIKKIDVVLYVLDGRAPLSCLNPKIDEIVKNKSVLYVINKADLIEKNDQEKIVNYFKSFQKNAICITGTDNSISKTLIYRLKTLLADKFEAAKNKGIEPIFKVMVIGTPNTGKSSIINSLCGKKKTMTGDKAGVTKQNQWVKINDNFVLLDTPGTLWPKMDNDLIKHKLAFIGGIKNDILDTDELGFQLIKFLIEKNPALLKNRYGVSNFEREPIEIYDDILRSKGIICKGGNVDYSRGGVRVLDDFRSGRLGKICLDEL